MKSESPSMRSHCEILSWAHVSRMSPLCNSENSRFNVNVQLTCVIYHMVSLIEVLSALEFCSPLLEASKCRRTHRNHMIRINWAKLRNSGCRNGHETVAFICSGGPSLRGCANLCGRSAVTQDLLGYLAR